MRALIGITALALVACSSAPTDPTKPDPTKPVQPTEPPPVPVYEATQYPASTGLGNMAGQVAADFTWDAFLAGAPAGQTGKISMHDFYDPDGARGINAVLIITSAEWCGACQAEAQTLEGKIRSKWGLDGVLVVELMMEDIQSSKAPANVTSAADRWRAKFSLTDMTVGIDPGFHFAKSGTNGLPVNVVIDPRTMTSMVRTDGSSSQVDSAIGSLVAKNKIQ